MFKYILSGLLLVSPVFADGGRQPKNQMSLGGVGTVQAKPDEGYVVVGVVTHNVNPATAMVKNRQSMVEMFRVLAGFGIKDEHIQTVDFSIQQKYKEVKNGNDTTTVPDGFVVSNQVRITVCDLPVFGKVLDALANSGANQMHGISFGSSKSKGLLVAARKKAVQEAKEKAVVIAAELGVELGDVILVSESSFRQQVSMYEKSRSAEPPATPIAGGSLSFSVSVNVTWELKQKGGSVRKIEITVPSLGRQKK